MSDSINSGIRTLIAALAEEVAARVVDQLRDQGTGSPMPAATGTIPDLLTEKEAVKHYRISPRTWQGWRANGRGPAFLKAGRRVLYRVTEIEKFLAMRNGHQQARMGPNHRPK